MSTHGSGNPLPELAQRYCDDILRLLNEVAVWGIGLSELTNWNQVPHPYSKIHSFVLPDGSTSYEHEAYVDVINEGFFNSPEGKACLSVFVTLVKRAGDMLEPQMLEKMIEGETPEALFAQKLVDVFEEFRRPHRLATDTVSSKLIGESDEPISIFEINNLLHIIGPARSKIIPFIVTHNYHERQAKKDLGGSDLAL